jgi:hypothetical protein
MKNQSGDNLTFDERGRFIIKDYAAARPFASLLPGIAGPMGIPMWVFYVNRGQAITSFGVENKDNPIMEFQPANKAYHVTPYTGFRTFVKIQRGGKAQIYEPFSPWHRTATTRRQMFIGMNELELQEINAKHGLQTNVLYFTLPGENLAGLVRQVTLKNVADRPVGLEVLDGMPAVMPYGVSNWGLKETGRTIEAWMEVVNLEQCIPFFRLRATAGDTAEVEAIQAGHFALSFVEQDSRAQLLPALVDPTVVFGQNTALNAPDRFDNYALAKLLEQRQSTNGKTPCGFFGASVTLASTETITINTLFGHVNSIENLQQQHKRLLSSGYIRRKRREARELTRELTDAIATKTSSPLFDAYCRQTFLDNVLRGGWPVLLGDEKHPFVYHIYFRRHGDPERDYNAFYMAAEYYSQGNGNYRDVNQNRRSDVLFNPRVADFNVRAFMSLIQADGYNPLVVLGSQFTLSPDKRAAVLEQVVHPRQLKPVLAQPFTPGQLLRHIEDHEIELRVSPDELLSLALQDAQQHFEAVFGGGYWIDHWTYNLDLIASYLAVYPDRKDDLLFGNSTLPFFDSPAIVRPRAEKYVLTDGLPRQLGAVVKDAEKEALITSRSEMPNLMRIENGRGTVYRTTLFAKLVCLAFNKFATMDPWGMGIEMEADKPGWYDAMNGLPGLFGSSMPETFELQRLLTFLLTAIEEREAHTISLPVEVYTFLNNVVAHLKSYNTLTDPQRDFVYWDAVAGAREDYRASVRLGFEGTPRALDLQKLAKYLTLFLEKVQAGVARALELNNGLPPTYFAYRVEDYEIIRDADGVPKRDANQRPCIRAKRFKPVVLPLFLEGPVRAFKIQPDQAAARQLYEQVKASPLFDHKLKMYKVNSSLENQPHDIGRAWAFTPGWLENESIWLHMEYKYLLEVLKAGLYEEFFEDFRTTLVAFQDPNVYGRSPLENSSFIVSSAHPDESIHGAGFVARLSGSTAEFLSMWNVMMTGKQPFFVQDGQLGLAFKPALPGWLFDETGTVTFTLLGHTEITYHNPDKADIFRNGEPRVARVILHTRDHQQIELSHGSIGAPYAEMVRAGQVKAMDVFFADGS